MASRRPERQRGFALLLVLWTMALLALLGGHLVAAARSATGQSMALRAAAEAETEADGLIEEAIFRLLAQGPGHWLADGVARPVRLAHGAAEVMIQNHAGRINPSSAAPELLRALLRGVGVDQQQAGRLAGAIVAWHIIGGGAASAAPYAAAGLPYGPPGQPFQSIDELGLVFGMTPDLLARLAPHLSVHTDGRVDLAWADPLVAQAVQQAGGGAAVGGAADEEAALVAEITVRVALPGARASRRAVVRIDRTEDDPAQLWQVLERE
jgi:general secretion pathway protein K